MKHLIMRSVKCFAMFLLPVFMPATISLVLAADFRSVTTLKPLQQPLKMQTSAIPTFCVTMSKIIKDTSQLHHELAMLIGPQGIALTGVGETGSYLGSLYPCCSQDKSFSVQEQQAAGCANSDTVGQCMEKLTKYCVNGIATQHQLKTKLEQDQKRTENISLKANQLSEKVKLLLNMMP